MKSFAIDLGGSRVKLALVEDGAIVSRDMIPARSQGGMAEALSDIAARLRALAAGHPGGVAGVGLAFAGLVDARNARVVTSNGKYPDAAGIDYARWAREAFGLPLVLENDANAALAGELAYGAARGAQDAAILILGTGVGTAACVEGRIAHGAHGQMGVLGGHICVDAFGARGCTCGSVGCLEAYASTWALSDLAREDAAFSQSPLARAAAVDYRALSEAWAENDPTALRLTERITRALGAGAVNLIHAYDPEVLVLSGGAIRFPALVPAIRRYVGERAWTPWGKVDVRVAADPEASVLLGLHALVEERSREAEPTDRTGGKTAGGEGRP